MQFVPNERRASCKGIPYGASCSDGSSVAASGEELISKNCTNACLRPSNGSFRWQVAAIESSAIAKENAFHQLSASAVLRIIKFNDLEHFSAADRFVDSESIPLRMKGFFAARATLTLPHSTVVLLGSFPGFLTPSTMETI